MFWLKLVKDFLAILREGQSPRQVAGGFMLGTIIGFSPVMTLQGILVWFIILVLDVNLASVFLAFTLCSLAAYFLDPVFHWLGFQLLVNVSSLQGVWTALYNMPMAPLSRFNNTMVMGSLVFSLVMAMPIYFGFKRFVVAYRSTIGAKVEQLKIFQWLKKSGLVRLYMRLRDMGGQS
jgi:uncharacterized protein (TIGR03546 family)